MTGEGVGHETNPCTVCGPTLRQHSISAYTTTTAAATTTFTTTATAVLIASPWPDTERALVWTFGRTPSQKASQWRPLVYRVALSARRRVVRGGEVNRTHSKDICIGM